MCLQTLRRAKSKVSQTLQDVRRVCPMLVPLSLHHRGPSIQVVQLTDHVPNMRRDWAVLRCHSHSCPIHQPTKDRHSHFQVAIRQCIDLRCPPEVHHLYCSALCIDLGGCSCHNESPGGRRCGVAGHSGQGVGRWYWSDPQGALRRTWR